MHSSIKMEVVLISFSTVAMFLQAVPKQTMYSSDLQKDPHTIVQKRICTHPNRTYSEALP